MKDYTRTLTARHPGTCQACKGAIVPGDKIARKQNRNGWNARGWNHARCELIWLCDGRTIQGSGGVALYVAISAEGKVVGDNRESVLGGIAEYAPDTDARAKAQAAYEDLPF